MPVTLKRFGLSEVVNHLLGNFKGEDETKAPIPFDFLIDGVLLRTSIEDYLTKMGYLMKRFLHWNIQEQFYHLHFGFF